MAGRNCWIRRIYNKNYGVVFLVDEEGKEDEKEIILPLKILRQNMQEVNSLRRH